MIILSSKSYSWILASTGQKEKKILFLKDESDSLCLGKKDFDQKLFVVEMPFQMSAISKAFCDTRARQLIFLQCVVIAMKKENIY